MSITDRNVRSELTFNLLLMRSLGSEVVGSFLQRRSALALWSAIAIRLTLDVENDLITAFPREIVSQIGSVGPRWNH